MTAALRVYPPRQAAILLILAGLHTGAFMLVAGGLAPRMLWSEPPQPPVQLFPPEPERVVLVAPSTSGPLDYALPHQPLPPVQIPHFDEAEPDTAIPGNPPGSGPGAGPDLPRVDSIAPALRVPYSRLAALIDRCYPSASRRLGEEGRAIVQISLDAGGNIAAWHVAESSGFPRLDDAVGCVLRKLEFVPGRRDGRAVPSSVMLPVAFRIGRSTAGGRTAP